MSTIKLLIGNTMATIVDQTNRDSATDKKLTALGLITVLSFCGIFIWLLLPKVESIAIDFKSCTNSYASLREKKVVTTGVVSGFRLFCMREKSNVIDEKNGKSFKCTRDPYDGSPIESDYFSWWSNYRAPRLVPHVNSRFKFDVTCDLSNGTCKAIELDMRSTDPVWAKECEGAYALGNKISIGVLK